MWVEEESEYEGSSKELAPTELALLQYDPQGREGGIHTAQNSEPKLKEARTIREGGYRAANAAPDPARNAASGRTGVAAGRFGGTDDEVKHQTRFRWVPDTGSHNLGIGQRSHTIHEAIKGRYR